MFKKHYLFAIAALLAIPVVVVVGGSLAVAIDPEWARGHADYVRLYRLIGMVRSAAMLAMFLAAGVLWLLTCLFLVRSREQSYLWACLAVFGPLGFMVLTWLRDRAPAPGDAYQQYFGKLGLLPRAAYELVLGVAMWCIAFAAMVAKRELMIQYQSHLTGMPVEEIVAIQDASSGMYAFSEGLEVLYLVVLFYLLWPVCLNLAHRLLGPRGPAPGEAPRGPAP